MKGLEDLAKEMRENEEYRIQKIKDEAENRKKEKENFRKDCYSGIKKVIVLVDHYHATEDKEMLRLQKWAKSQGLGFEITEDLDRVVQEVQEDKKDTLLYLADNRRRVKEKIQGKAIALFDFDDEWPPHVVVDEYNRSGGSKGWYRHEYFVRELELIALAQGLDTWHFDLELQATIAGCLAKYTLPWKVMEYSAVVKLVRGNFSKTKTSKKMFKTNVSGKHALLLVCAKDSTPTRRACQWELLCAIRKKYGDRILLEGEWRSHGGGISFQKLVIDAEQFMIDVRGAVFSEAKD